MRVVVDHDERAVALHHRALAAKYSGTTRMLSR
jgi:hypothetical protein